VRDAALITSARAGDTAAVRRLLAEGASVMARDATGATALIAATHGRHLETARVLIAAGADVNAKDNTVQSAYLIATSEIGGDAAALEMLRLMLASGADVDSLDSYNGTGLIRAADRGFIEIVRELLKTGIKIDHVNRLGWTALLEAVILGRGDANHTEVVRLLVSAGANVNLADGSGKTPLAHARERGYTQIAAILTSAGAR
jgi:ankyrin repeat protein